MTQNSVCKNLRKYFNVNVKHDHINVLTTKPLNQISNDFKRNEWHYLRAIKKIWKKNQPKNPMDKRDKLLSTLVRGFLEQLCKFPGCCALSLLFYLFPFGNFTILLCQRITRCGSEHLLTLKTRFHSALKSYTNVRSFSELRQRKLQNWKKKMAKDN